MKYLVEIQIALKIAKRHFQDMRGRKTHEIESNLYNLKRFREAEHYYAAMKETEEEAKQRAEREQRS